MAGYFVYPGLFFLSLEACSLGVLMGALSLIRKSLLHVFVGLFFGSYGHLTSIVFLGLGVPALLHLCLSAFAFPFLLSSFLLEQFFRDRKKLHVFY